jgi:hypothetical protein
MFEELGLVGRPAFVPYVGGGASSDGSEWGENASKVAPSIREGAERARKEMAA